MPELKKEKNIAILTLCVYMITKEKVIHSVVWPKLKICKQNVHHLSTGRCF